MTRPHALVVCLLLIAAAPNFAQNLDDFEGVVDFQTTLKELDGLLRARRFDAGPQRLLVLDGTVRSITVESSEPETYTAIVELVKGEWLGLEEVRSYKSVILFQGAQFADVFPARRGAEPGPRTVPVNARAVVVAKVAQAVQLPSGEIVWLLEGYFIRKL